MKIEKISETQIKFILTQSDLLDRDIKLEELILPSDKTNSLFHDIMEQALKECNFSAENVPLMVEAVPVSYDGIMIIVTKIQDDENSKDKLKLLSQNKGIYRYKRKPISVYEPSEKLDDQICIYSFDTLDDVINVSTRLYGYYHGTNSLLKYNNRYFLTMQNDILTDNIDLDDLEIILGDYGQKHISSKLSKYHLIEHGEIFIKNSAIKVLAKNLA